MRRSLAAVLSTAAIAAVLGLPGCSSDEDDASPTSAQASTSASMGPTAAPQAAPLPPPQALAGVLSRLADASVPGPQKLNLVEGATPESAGVFDQFANALINGGFAPVKFDVRDVELVRPGPRRRAGQRRRQLNQCEGSAFRVPDGIQALPRRLAAVGAHGRCPAGIPGRHPAASDDSGSLTTRVDRLARVRSAAR